MAFIETATIQLPGQVPFKRAVEIDQVLDPKNMPDYISGTFLPSSAEDGTQLIDDRDISGCTEANQQRCSMYFHESRSGYWFTVEAANRTPQRFKAMSLEINPATGKRGLESRSGANESVSDY